jgi:hypothetical protein
MFAISVFFNLFLVSSFLLFVDKHFADQQVGSLGSMYPAYVPED